MTSNYTYDNSYQLTQVTQGSSTTESYSYDSVGNRLSSLGVSPYAYNSSNELTSTPSVSYTYDHNGNTTSKTDSSGTTTYNWDSDNELTSVVLPASAGTVSFKYDPSGRRVQMSSSSGTVNYLYDGADLVEEVDNAGNTLARYVQGQRFDEPFAVLRSGSTAYYEADDYASITSLSDPTGSLLNTYTYNSFGRMVSSTGTFGNPFRYTGRDFDLDSGLHYYRARYYDDTSGRFMSEDPLLFKAGSANFYAYVRNRPTRYVDPLGLEPTNLNIFDSCTMCHMKCDLGYQLAAATSVVASFVRGFLAGIGTGHSIGQDDPVSIAKDAKDNAEACVNTRNWCHADCNLTVCDVPHPAFPNLGR